MARDYFKELDKVAALVGSVFSLVLTILLTLLGRITWITAGVLSFSACVCYLVIRKDLPLSSLISPVLENASMTLHFVLNAFFFLFLTLAILFIAFRPDPYSRPLGFFVSLSLMSSTLSVEVLFLPIRRCFRYFALLKVFLVAAIIDFSQTFLFPSVIGVDPWRHQSFTYSILNQGHIPAGFGYSNLPFFHLLTGLTSLTTGLDYKLSTALSICLPQIICNILLVFILGSFLLDTKVGLLGGLLLAVSNYNVAMGSWSIPNTMAAVFVPTIAYLLLKMRREKPIISISLAIFLMGALILTHTITSAWLATLLFVFWAMSKAYNWAYNEQGKHIPFSIPILFSVGMFSWWTYASGHLNVLADTIKWGFHIDQPLGNLPEKIAQYSNGIPSSEQLFNDLGVFLYFAISIIGCLYMVSRRSRGSSNFALAIGAVATLAVGFFAPIMGLGIIEDRWFYFSQILLALPLGLALFLLCSNLKNRLRKSLLMATFTFLLSLSMMLNSVANISGPTFSPNMQVRFALTKSELQAVDSLSSKWTGDLGVDTYYSLMTESVRQTRSIDMELYDKNYSDCQTLLVLIREEIVCHPLLLNSSIYKLDYDPRDVLAVQCFSRVYDSDSVVGFAYSG